MTRTPFERHLESAHCSGPGGKHRRSPACDRVDWHGHTRCYLCHTPIRYVLNYDSWVERKRPSNQVRSRSVSASQ
jgi:hypothetical protein